MHNLFKVKTNKENGELTRPPMEPETSMQKMTMELSSPLQLVATVAGAGLIM